MDVEVPKSRAGTSAGGSGSRPGPGGGAAALDAAGLVARYEALRRQHAEEQSAEAPAIIAANRAQLLEWAERMRADLASRSSGGPPLPRTATGTGGCAASGAGAPARPGGSALQSGAAASGAAGAAADGGSVSEGGEDSYSSAGSGGPRKRRAVSQPAASAAPSGPAAAPSRRPPPPAQHADGGPAWQLPTRGGVVITASGARMGRYKTHVLPATDKLPRYCSWEFLPRNELARDAGRRMFYADASGETVPASDEEEDESLRLPWNGTEGPSHDYALGQLLAEAGEAQQEQLLSVLADHLEVAMAELAEHTEGLRPAPPRREDTLFEGYARQASTIDDAFCRRCFIYNCSQHAGPHVKPALRPAPPPPPGADAPPCSPACWRACGGNGAAAAAAAAAVQGSPQAAAAAGGSGAAAAAATAAAGAAEAAAAARSEWTRYDLELLQQAVRLMGWDPCQAVLALDPYRFTCADVHARMESMRREEGGAAAAAAAAARRRGDGGGRWGKRRGQNDKARIKAIEQHGKAAWRAVVSRRFHDSTERGWPAYAPCACAGPCRVGSCSCIASGNFCEKFCGCVGCAEAKCRFSGCKCTAGCRTNHCPCLLANRECDPDVCRGCAATADGEAAGGAECCNMSIRLGRRKRLAMGLSATHGWGAFIAEPVAKGGFICEYTGDLLSQEEADRRGRVYDRIDNSYLFNVNQEWVLDARRRGNKLRFANHSTRPNSVTRVVQVDGDHRVALYAARDIKPGDELTYNYRYDLSNAPDWAL
ncbi:hypothetical protein Rsub_02578 [Raphidocelis subcapitata]|uniref:Histone-lysine N-methyltransferase n=1 Tax=Raphidocelis subcapitata TaxID=307507 RepID=A0A2V0NQG9_9CHLO|nr:hypothetical protein Rsub_02578 [Raphidocelis subcapitata]|eukprot:GBF89874.1 hypothetical protein Rsub_02578 [Raphidocelis subcapitata]